MDIFDGNCVNIGLSQPTRRYTRGLASYGSQEERTRYYAVAVEEKSRLTAVLRKRNDDKLLASGAEVITGRARFVSPHELAVRCADGSRTL